MYVSFLTLITFLKNLFLQLYTSIHRIFNNDFGVINVLESMGTLYARVYSYL